MPLDGCAVFEVHVGYAVFNTGSWRINESYLAGIVLLPELALSEFRSMSRCSCGKDDGLASVAEGIGHMIAFVSQKIRALNKLGTLENISAAFTQRASWGSPSGIL